MKLTATLRNIFIPLLLLLIAANCSDTKSDSLTTYDADVFFETVTYGLSHSSGHAFSSDGTRLLFNSDQSGVFNAYTKNLETGKLEGLSSSNDNSIFAVSWFPNDDRVMLTGDVGGNEQNSVFIRDPDGTLHDLLPPGDYEVAGQQSGLRFESWQSDGEAFFLTSTERDPQLADLYKYDAETYEREMVFQNTRELPFPTRGFNVSPNGRWLALDFHITRYHFDIYLVDLHSDDRTPQLILAPEEGEALHRGITYTPDSRKLVYGTDKDGEFLQAWTYDLDTGETEQLIETEWDITSARTGVDSGVTYSADGTWRVEIINADSRNEVTIRNLETGQPLDLSFLPDGMISSPQFTPDGSALAVELERDSRPTDLLYVDLEAKTYERLTEALNSAIEESHLVESKVVRFDSYDGLSIPGLMYRPHCADINNPVPAMVWVHGGPGAQSRQGYNPVIQFIVNQGYAVYAINNRGSRGYGKTFRAMDRRAHGEADLGDVVASREFLESIDWIDENKIAAQEDTAKHSGRWTAGRMVRPIGDVVATRKFLESIDWINENKIGVMGRSYGGFLTFAALTFHPQVFDVAISIVGFSDYISNITEGGWRLPRLPAAYDEMGHPEEDAERLRRGFAAIFCRSNFDPAVCSCRS